MQTGAANLRTVADLNLVFCGEDLRLGVTIAREKFLFTKHFSNFRLLLSLVLVLEVLVLSEIFV